MCQPPTARAAAARRAPSDSRANSFGTFLLGLPTQLGKVVETLTSYTTRVWQYSLYVRDRWQVNREAHLLVSAPAGSTSPCRTRADRGFERYNPETNMMEIGGVGSVPVDLGVKSKRLFAPRFGLAYRATDKFVIRAGYGLTNDPYSMSRPMRTNHPVLIELNVTGSEQPLAGRPAGRRHSCRSRAGAWGTASFRFPATSRRRRSRQTFERGYIQSWNLMLERNLGAGFVAEAGYVATRQIRQLGFRELNWAPIGGGSCRQAAL